jgi:Mg2+ and Co2+ transporter CorA
LRATARPKVDEYNHGLFLVVPTLRITSKRKTKLLRLREEQVDSDNNNENLEASEENSYIEESDEEEDDSDDDDDDDDDEDVMKAFLDLQLETDSISIFLVESERTVITVQQKVGDSLDPLRKYLRNSWSKVRSKDHSFLLCKYGAISLLHKQS